MTEAEVAWVAGIIEGEGCVYIVDPPDGPGGAQIQVRMTDHDVVRSLHRITGVGRVNGPFSPKKKTWKPCFAWQVSVNADVLDILRKVIPWLHARRKATATKAILVIEKALRLAAYRDAHCKHDHKRTDETVYTGPDGKRRCRICQLEGQRRRRAS